MASLTFFLAYYLKVNFWSYSLPNNLSCFFNHFDFVLGGYLYVCFLSFYLFFSLVCHQSSHMPDLSSFSLKFYLEYSIAPKQQVYVFSSLIFTCISPPFYFAPTPHTPLNRLFIFPLDDLCSLHVWPMIELHPPEIFSGGGEIVKIVLWEVWNLYWKSGDFYCFKIEHILPHILWL